MINLKSKDIQYLSDDVTLWGREPSITTHSLNLPNINGYAELSNLTWPKNGFFCLHNVHYEYDHFKLPDDYDYYVLSWHGEFIDFAWLHAHLHITKPVIILTDFKVYDCTFLPDNFIFVRWLYAHHVANTMMQWFGTTYKKNIKYKASAFCHRITQSKMWITTALLESLNREDLFVKLNDRLELKNVHNWQPCGSKILDDLSEKFKNKWLGKSILVDQFEGYEDNIQSINGNPNHPAYTECAIHFTNESWHYSKTNYNNTQAILPGPNFSEKTFKCLIAGTAFIPVGQFDVYNTLSEFGLQFDYGPINLDFDTEAGDINRFEKIVDVIDTIASMSAEDIYTATKDCTEYNQNVIVSGKFSKKCDNFNQNQIDNLATIIKEIG